MFTIVHEKGWFSLIVLVHDNIFEGVEDWIIWKNLKFLIFVHDKVFNVPLLLLIHGNDIRCWVNTGNAKRGTIHGFGVGGKKIALLLVKFRLHFGVRELLIRSLLSLKGEFRHFAGSLFVHFWGSGVWWLRWRSKEAGLGRIENAGFLLFFQLMQVFREAFLAGFHFGLWSIRWQLRDGVIVFIFLLKGILWPPGLKSWFESFIPPLHVKQEALINSFVDSHFGFQHHNLQMVAIDLYFHIKGFLDFLSTWGLSWPVVSIQINKKSYIKQYSNLSEKVVCVTEYVVSFLTLYSISVLTAVVALLGLLKVFDISICYTMGSGIYLLLYFSIYYSITWECYFYYKGESGFLGCLLNVESF